MRSTLAPLQLWTPVLPIAKTALSKGTVENVASEPSSVLIFCHENGSTWLPLYANSHVDRSKIL